MASHDEFRASFDKAVADAQKLLDELSRDIALAKQVGDETLAASLEATKALVPGPTRTRAQIEDATGALREENVAKERGVELDLAEIERLKQKATLLKEEAALRESISGLRGRDLQAEAAASPRVTGVRGADPRAEEALALSGTRGYDVAAEAAAASAQRQAGLLTALQQEELSTQRQVVAEIDAEIVSRERLVTTAAQQLAFDQARLEVLKAERIQRAYRTGQEAGASGYLVSKDVRSGLQKSAPEGLAAGEWTKADAALVRYNTALGEYDGFATRASLSTQALTANLVRLGIADAEASNQLRAHGALTTEFLGALARGETTVSEFGYQIGATIGKFAGWTAAAAATYGALGAVFEFGKGAIDTASGVQQLTRTIEPLNRQAASISLQNLSADVNVPIKEASDTVFQFSRTFHNLGDAVTVAKLALAAFKLDGVAVSDTVKAATAIHQQFGITANGLVPVFDQLAQGQQRFNARITEMIPLLTRSSGAIKNAGGDLGEFLQLATIALRTTQLSGSQLGTIFQRAASNYLNPATPHGQKDLADIQSLTGVNAVQVLQGPGGITTLLAELLKFSATATNAERARLTTDVGGTGYGGRFAAFFGGGGAALQRPVAQAFGDSTGVLNKELQKELHTAGQELSSFKNELQRFGAALADSGLVDVFTTMVGALVGVIDVGRQAIDIFDSLPRGIKDAIEALLALRLAMLVVSRTRLGGSIPGISNVPGFRPTEATVARQSLVLGTRNAIQAVEDDVARSTAQSIDNGARQVALERQRALIQAQITEAGGGSAAQLEESNRLDARIAALQRQQLTIEEERNAQLAALATLKSQQVGLTAINRNRRLSDEEVLGLQATVQGTGASGADAAIAANAAAKERLALAQARTTLLLHENQGVTAEVGAAMVEEAAAAEALAATEAAVSTEAVASAGILGRFTGGARGLVAALDPLTVGLLAAPFAFAAISDGFKKASDAADSASKAAALPTKDIAGLIAKAKALEDAAKKQADAKYQSSIPIIGGGISAVVNSVDSLVGYNNRDPNKTKGLAAPLQALGVIYQGLAAQYQSDGQALIKTQSGRARLAREADTLTQWAEHAAKEHLPDDLAKQSNAVTAFSNSLAAITKSLRLTATRQGTFQAPNDLTQFATLTAAQISAQVKSLDDFSKVFGVGGEGAIKQAAAGYAVLASKYANKKDDTSADLQNLATAQQSLVSGITKSVEDSLTAAKNATSKEGQQAGLDQAFNNYRIGLADIKRVVGEQLAADKGHAIKIAGDLAAAQQLYALLSNEFANAIQAQLSEIQSRTALATSQISGSSPETAIAQAQSSLSGLQQELAFAQSKKGTPLTTIQDLQTQINNANNALATQQTANARAILQARGQVSTGSIQGTSTQAEIQRAQQEVTNARSLLGFDQSHGGGAAQILSDQAALDTATQALLTAIKAKDQALRQDLAAYIEAQAALAEASTTDPVKQAQLQLRADTKVLGTIKPGDFKTQREYQTALLQQQAKVAKDKESVTTQIVDTQERTLQFELSTQRISDQQYVQGLQRLLRIKKLSLQQRQTILQDIFNIQNQSSNAGDLSLTNIRLPTAYEIRRAVTQAQQGVNITNHNSVTVQVLDHRTVNAVGVVLDRYIKGTGKAIRRAGGVPR